jgi:hypothetical protein
MGSTLRQCAPLFAQLDPELGAYFEIMIREHLLDLEERPAKASRGYSLTLEALHRPFIFGKLQTVQEIRLILHEAGHAFHSFEMGTLPYIQQRKEAFLPMEFAEVASITMEFLANGLINAYWRNKSGIEDIHAGQWSARPLLQRRITPYQEYELVREIAEGFVPNMHAIYNVINKKSDDGWEERIFSLAINFHPPYDWSLTEQTRDVLLEGAEPELQSNEV